MDYKEFVVAIHNADEETIKAVFQLLKVNPQPVEFPGLPSGNSHKAS